MKYDGYMICSIRTRTLWDVEIGSGTKFRQILQDGENVRSIESLGVFSREARYLYKWGCAVVDIGKCLGPISRVATKVTSLDRQQLGLRLY